MIRALSWANRFEHCMLLNSNGIKYPFQPFINVMAIGAHTEVVLKSGQAFEELRSTIDLTRDWLFGHINYDLKNEIEALVSENTDRLEFPEISFFQPQHLIFFEEDGVTIETYSYPHHIYDEIMGSTVPEDQYYNIRLSADTSRAGYLETIETLKDHIREGDIYEINYCLSFFADSVQLDPVNVYQRLNVLSPTPFSSFYRCKDHYLFCASPERFLKKVGNRLICQPMKGTARRGQDPLEDEHLKQQLATDEKELAENMMIVDLVRNDLAQSCRAGSVSVQEMFGIYSFRHWHQMISTITGELRPEVHGVEAIKNAFPMGSMTGAPKVKVMELIEKYERTRRSIFSGTLGYFAPNGDFDFNVVIRSLIYNSTLQRVVFHVGGAITYDSDPEREYEECMLKASALMHLLSGQ